MKSRGHEDRKQYTFSFQEEYLGVFLHGVLLDASLKQARYGLGNRQF
jgi:hypothetical protein